MDMTDGELLWAHKCGFEPLGVVLGNSVYHIGLQVKRWSQNQELEVLTQAMQNASDLAISRMLAEAQQLGADGVLVVAFTVGRNVEMTNYTQAVYDARELAMTSRIRRLYSATHDARFSRPPGTQIDAAAITGLALARTAFRPRSGSAKRLKCCRL